MYERVECIRSCTTIRSAFHLAHVTYITMYLEEGKAYFARIERTLTCLLADSSQSTIIIIVLARLHALEMISCALVLLN